MKFFMLEKVLVIVHILISEVNSGKMSLKNMDIL